MKKKLISKRKLCFIMAVVMICLSACSEELEYVQEPIIEESVFEETEHEQEKDTEELQQPVQSESEEKSEEEILEEFAEYLEEITKEKQNETEEVQEIKADGFDREKAQEAFSKVNEQRAANGVAELAWDEALYELACVRAKEIVSQFSHQRPDGSYVGDVMLNQYGATGCGENIASNYQSITNLINGWLNSEGHKENMLDDRFTAAVMACYYYDGSYYWVNLFKR